MSEQLTDWIYIDKHGHPIRDGWYEVLYDHQDDDDGPSARYFVDGKWFLDDKRNYTAFGYWPITGERWRCLTQPQGKERG